MGSGLEVLWGAPWVPCSGTAEIHVFGLVRITSQESRTSGSRRPGESFFPDLGAGADRRAEPRRIRGLWAANPHFVLQIRASPQAGLLPTFSSLLNSTPSASGSRGKATPPFWQPCPQPDPRWGACRMGEGWGVGFSGSSRGQG